MSDAPHGHWSRWYLEDERRFDLHKRYDREAMEWYAVKHCGHDDPWRHWDAAEWAKYAEYEDYAKTGLYLTYRDDGLLDDESEVVLGLVAFFCWVRE